MKSNNKIQGISGYLLGLTIIISIFALLFTICVIIEIYSLIMQFQIVFIIYLMIFGLLDFLVILTLILEFLYKPRFLVYCIMFFWTMFFMTIFYDVLFEKGYSMMTIFAIVVPFLVTWYLTKSVRVKNTFVK